MARSILVGNIGGGIATYRSGKAYDRARRKGLDHDAAKAEALKWATVEGGGVGAGIGLVGGAGIAGSAINGALGSLGGSMGAHKRIEDKRAKELALQGIEEDEDTRADRSYFRSLGAAFRKKS